MKYYLKILFATILIAFSMQGFSAVKVVECEDERGGRSFQKACPPGSTQVSSKRISTGESSEEANRPDIKATLYVIPDCEECDEAREFLQMRNISFEEKNALESKENLNELKEFSVDLQVPVTVINNEVIIGYKRSEIEELLAKAGSGESKSSSDE